MLSLPLLLALGSFGLVLLVTLVPYWFLVVRVEQQEKSSLRKRIVGATETRVKRAAMLRTGERLSIIGPLEDILRRSRFIVDPLQRLIAQSGLTVTVATIVLSSGVMGLLTFVLIARASGALLLGLVAAPAVGYGPLFVLQFARRRRMDKFEEQFPEAIDLIARTLRAGHAFTTGLRMAGEELPNPIGAEFRTLSDRQNFGLPVPDALRDFADRMPILDARFFVTAVLTQREAGGNLAEVLDNLSTVIRERFRVKRQVRVITSHGRYTGMLLSILPPAMAIILFARQPENIRLMFTDPVGIRMVAFAVVLQIIGAIAIRKISNVEY